MSLCPCSSVWTEPEISNLVVAGSNPAADVMSKKLTDEEIKTRLDVYNEILEFLQGPNWENKIEENQCEIIYNEIFGLQTNFRRKHITRIYDVTKKSPRSSNG